MLKKSLFISLIVLVLVCLVSPVFAQTSPVWTVDATGQILKGGQPYRIKGGSWFGLEGRYELVSDANNPAGAPMEQYMGNVFWAESNRTYDADAAEMKTLGFNTIRLPLVHQTLDNNDPQGKDPFLKNATMVRIQGARSALETVIKACNKAGLCVLLDIHSCSNYVGWRKGRLDARPPWVDATRDYYPFTRDECSCAATNNPANVTRIQAYDETIWKADLTVLANMDKTCTTNCLIGIDIYNEPWDYSWAEWKKLIESAYASIYAVNPNILIFAQGIGSTNGNQDGAPNTKNDTPHGSAGNPNWGENLYEAGANPPNIPKYKLVYSPHCYGPSVCPQGMFADPSQPQCATLQEDAFGDAKCQIVIDPSKLEPSWEEHFGYLRDLGYAICIGEFGGNLDWPAKSEQRMQNRYSYLTNKQSDLQWQTAFVNYLVKKGIKDGFYWAINPESNDTGGIYRSPYDPITNTGGWGTWLSPDQRKLTLLQTLWNPPPTWPPIIPTPPVTTPPTCNLSGDANSNGITDINDALLIVRYSAGFPVTINNTNSDVNCDNIITINDALIVARKTAGL